MNVIGRVSFLLAIILLAVCLERWMHIETRSKLVESDTKISVIGAVLLDFLAEPHEDLIIKTSNPGSVHISWGGVSRNIALASSISLPLIDQDSSSQSVFFVSVLGNDILGQGFYSEHSLFNTNGVKMINSSTGVYLAVAEGPSTHNDMHTAIAQVDILKQLTPDYVAEFENEILKSKIVVIDGNLSKETLFYIVDICGKNNIPVWFEPTSVFKSCKVFESEPDLSYITYISPNIYELEKMADYVKQKMSFSSDMHSSIIKSVHGDRFEKEKENIISLLYSGIHYIVTTMGPDGTLLGYRNGDIVDMESIKFIHFPAPPADVIQVNGAGDAMAGCCISSIVSGKTIEESILIGHACAKLQLETKPLTQLSELLQ